MLHELKLNQKYCDSVYWGVKPFEIRFNDREFKVGDFVRFIAVNDNDFLVGHKINSCYYQITYVLSDFCGLAENYVALSIDSFKCFFNCCKNFEERGIEACFGCTGSKIESDFNNHSDCHFCTTTNSEEFAQMTDFANWIIEKRKKEQQGN